MAEGEMSFKDLDEGLALLEQTVKKLEDNALSIDEAIQRYSEGMKLAVACRRSLNQLTHRVSEVRREAMTAIAALESEEEKVKSQLASQLADDGNLAGSDSTAGAACSSAAHGAGAAGADFEDKEEAWAEDLREGERDPSAADDWPNSRNSSTSEDIPF